ncbi:transposase [Hydrogenispora sp. UU3]|uniref:Transposase n=1 Tax=Capillibacterium thermochitinicola TaxID=2699427 RepID=A0A8J6I4K9_9FIRM|nr:transposase [Capillibacterium thermochitinicola]
MDIRIRNDIVVRFGEGKRCYGLGRIMAKLQETSETVIHLQFLVDESRTKTLASFLPSLDGFFSVVKGPSFLFQLEFFSNP